MKLKKYLNAALANPKSIPWRVFSLVRRRLPAEVFFNGWSFPPDIVTILVTKKCNLTCPGCSSSSPVYTRTFKGEEISVNQVKKFIEEISWFRPSIYFNGGEPTLRKDLPEMISFAKSKDLVTAFTTNGSLLLFGDIIDKIINSKLDFLSVSLDGTAEHHNSYRGSPKAYERLTEGLAALVKRRRELSVATPHIRMTCIINPESSEDAKFVLNKAEEIGVDEVAFGNLMFYPKSYEEKQRQVMEKDGTGGPHMIGWAVDDGKFPFEVAYDELDKVYAEIKSVAKLPTTFVPESLDHHKFFSFQDPATSSRCFSPWTIATLLPNGDLTSCQEYILGNIKDSSFLSLWNGEKMRKFRRYRKNQPFPACFRCLEGHEIAFE